MTTASSAMARSHSVSKGQRRPRRASAGSGLPAGRALCARLAELIVDEADGANNRFEVAAALNREIQAALAGGGDGPFWGHPAGHAYLHLTPKRPRPFPAVPNGRLVERTEREGMATTHWKMETDHASYLISIIQRIVWMNQPHAGGHECHIGV